MTVVQVNSQTSVPLTTVPAASGTNILIVNQDIQANVFIGDSSVSASSGAAYQVQPLGTLSIPASTAWYAINDSQNTPPSDITTIQVIPGGSDWTTPPGDIAAALDIAGLATATALAILKSGVSLISEPTLLWGSGAGGGGGGGSVGTNIFGSHVPPAGYGSQFSQNDWISAATFWDSVVGAKIAQHQIRWYYTEGQFDTTLAQLTSTWPGLVNWINGTTDPAPSVIISYRPDRTGVLPGGTLNSHGTAQKNLLASALAMLKASFPQVLWTVCLFHEAQGKDSNGTRRFPFTYTDSTGTHTITFVDYMKAYGPTVTAAAVSNFAYICLPSAEQVNNCFNSTFWSGTNVEGYTQICADYYGVDSYTGGVRLNAGSWGLPGNVGGLVGVSQALASPLPIGLTEIGASVGTHPPQATYSAYIDHIIAVMSSLPTALQGGPINWYQGTTPGGANLLLASGLNADGVSLVGSPAVGDGLKALYNACSAQPGSGGGGSGSFTVAGGATAIPAPINPSPGGGYAIANGLSYDISIIGIAGAASTNPFVTVQMKWKNTDVTGAKSIHEERWTVPLGVSTSSGTVITGRGPMHGQFLSIHVVNRDTDTANITMQVNQTGRPVNQHDWQWDAINSVNIPGYNLPGGSPFSNSLGSINNVTVPANGSITRLLSLFSGEVYMKMSASGASVLNYVINPQPSSVFGSAAIFNDSNPASGELLTPTMKLPRGPVQVTVNNSTGAGIGAFMEIIALDRG